MTPLLRTSLLGTLLLKRQPDGHGGLIVLPCELLRAAMDSDPKDLNHSCAIALDVVVFIATEVPAGFVDGGLHEGVRGVFITTHNVPVSSLPWVADNFVLDGCFPVLVYLIKVNYFHPPFIGMYKIHTSSLRCPLLNVIGLLTPSLLYRVSEIIRMEPSGVKVAQGLLTVVADSKGTGLGLFWAVGLAEVVEQDRILEWLTVNGLGEVWTGVEVGLSCLSVLVLTLLFCEVEFGRGAELEPWLERLANALH